MEVRSTGLPAESTSAPQSGGPRRIVRRRNQPFRCKCEYAKLCLELHQKRAPGRSKGRSEGLKSSPKRN